MLKRKLCLNNHKNHDLNKYKLGFSLSLSLFYPSAILSPSSLLSHPSFLTPAGWRRSPREVPSCGLARSSLTASLSPAADVMATRAHGIHCPGEGGGGVNGGRQEGREERKEGREERKEAWE